MSSISVLALLFAVPTSYAKVAVAHKESPAKTASVSDSVITAKVKIQLLANKKIKATHISVTTKQGMVTLSGTVGSLAETLIAIKTAAGIAGVKDVDASLLSVHSDVSP